MKFKKITYLIDDSYGRGGRAKQVTGYAMDFYPVRLCVREESRHNWTIDHFETGCGVLIRPSMRRTREAAAIAGAREMFKRLISGEYQQKISEYESRAA